MKGGTYVVLGVFVPDSVEPEIPIETARPPCQRVQELGKRRMNVKVIFSPDVLGGEGSEVDFVEAVV